MREWLRSHFRVSEDGSTIESIGVDGYKIAVAIEDFVAMFGEAPPLSLADLKARDPDDSLGWHQHFDAWAAQGIIQP